MEGDSLDDFFAKKDKSKKKGKAKVTPGDILAQQEEKPKKKTKRKKEEKPSGQEPSEVGEDREKETKAPQPPDEEEWADYEQEEKDYTGLRIQTLQMRDEASDDDKDKQGSGDEDGEEGEKGEGSRGPWNKGQHTQNIPAPVVQEEAPPAEPKPEPPREEAPAKIPGKYVPPGARHSAASGPSIGPTPLRRGGGGKKNAPNIQSEEDFPTLGGAAPAESHDSNPMSFERVRGGGRQVEDERSKGLKLQLGNKFASLGE